ncbi:hypothetical protein OAA05_00395 [bacterium]|nr:hypothetical protein [bacterium]
MNETLEYCRQLINNQPLVFSDYIGFSGVALLIVTYAMLQLDKIDPKGFWYSFNNMIVAILVTFSLLVTMNKASMVIEVFWFIISVYGIVMYFKRKNES